MSTSSISHSFRYGFNSQLGNGDEHESLKLATSMQADSYPYFFEGQVLNPRPAALMLFALSRVVGSRFYTPPAMLKRIIAASDPVVTSGGGYLRFEGFSACCSAYARVDISPDAYKGQVVGQGTTNVDFNTQLKSTLIAIRNSDRMGLSVGTGEVVLKRNFESVVEKKVDLPVRWLKGFVEVQSYQSEMAQVFSLNKAETQSFLRSLPRSARPESCFWVVQVGKGLRLSQTKTSNAVKIGGIERLNLLRDLAVHADSLTVFALTNGQASEWQLSCDGLKFCLTVTAEASRGFSGEGQVLESLANSNVNHLAKLKSLLKWQSAINLDEVAKSLELSASEVRATLATLGAQGYVGFDLSNKAFYHRELPYKLDALEEMHPRLKAAYKLVQNGGVKLHSESGPVIAVDVQGSTVTHRVGLGSDRDTCTCPWYSKNQGDRGPCKHILAAKLQLEPNYD